MSSMGSRRRAASLSGSSGRICFLACWAVGLILFLRTAGWTACVLAGGQLGADLRLRSPSRWPALLPSCSSFRAHWDDPASSARSLVLVLSAKSLPSLVPYSLVPGIWVWTSLVGGMTLPPPGSRLLEEPVVQ